MLFDDPPINISLKRTRTEAGIMPYYPNAKRGRTTARFSTGRFGRTRSMYGAYAGARSRSRLSRPAGVAGTTRSFAARVVRDMPLFAPRNVPVKFEQKYFDLTQAGYVADTTGTITHINPVPLGDSILERHGARFLNTQVQLRGILLAGSAGTVANAVAYVVWDRQPQGALPAITDIFDVVNANSYQVTSTRDRFRLMVRLNYSVTGNSTTPATGLESRSIDSRVAMRQPTTYLSGATVGTIASVQTGALYLVTMGSAVAGTTAPTWFLRIRTLFADT